MHSLKRSLPSGITSTDNTPPVSVGSDGLKGKMAGSSVVDFFKNILLPVFIAAVLYLLLFHALLPLYRQHRARYSQYLPLQSTSLSSRLPASLQPSSLRDRFGQFLLRIFMPSTWAFREHIRRRESIVSADEPLFDEEAGEAMVGFDVEERNRRRDGMDRQVAQGILAAREMGGYTSHAERRLSRELEEGFRDESENSDDEAEESTVTAGRRSFSAPR